MIRKTLLGIVLVALTSVSALAVPIAGNGIWGDFTGDISYSDIAGADLGQLTLTLNNISNPANSGYLTAVALNLPGAYTVTQTSTTDADFGLLGGPTFNNSVAGSPFGDFDFGSSTGGGWTGGGAPQPGIAPGGSLTLVFAIAGSGADGLGVDSFANALSANSNQAQWLAVRFRGFTNGQSDKVFSGDPGCAPTEPGCGGGSNEVPEPTTMGLLGAGLAGLAILRRRK